MELPLSSGNRVEPDLPRFSLPGRIVQYPHLSPDILYRDIAASFVYTSTVLPKLGIENHSYGEDTNVSRKSASNAKRYPLFENRRIPFTRTPPVSCLLGCCPNPRRTQKLCSGTQDKSCGYAIFQIADGRKFCIFL